MARPGQRVVSVPGARTSHIPITDFAETRRLIADSYEISSRFLAARYAGSAVVGE